MLAERLSQLGDVGGLRLEKKLSLASAALERQQEEFVGALNRRLGEVEEELRERLSSLAAEEEAERAALEARLGEIARRIDEVVARAEERLGSLSHSAR